MNINKEVVFDIEGNGLYPTIIHCMVYNIDGGIFHTTDYNIMREVLSSAPRLVGHNIARFDIPTLERLLKVKITSKIVDTLALSWVLEPNRPRHSLNSYGNEFGIPKPVIDNWEDLPIEEYIHRCTEDVKINTHLWNKQYNYLRKLYLSDEALFKYTDYLGFKMYCARLAEQSRWKVDLKLAGDNLLKLELEKIEKVKTLKAMMPSVPVKVIKKRPKVFLKKDGSLSSKGQEWLDLVTDMNLPDDTQEIELLKGYEEPNPSSVAQIKGWLFSLGWKPKTFKYDGKREIPQVSLPHGKGICDSVKELFEKHPGLEVLEGLSVLGHRISILKSFVTENENGFVKATVQGLTNTLRFQHAKPCVNLPKPDRPYASSIRQSLVARDGYELCGADKSSLEDRLKQHYIYPYDPDYVKEMQAEGFDPHLKVALTAGMLTQDEVDEYKGGNKKNSRVRDMAKNGGYAMQYGARPPRLVKTLDITLEKAKQIFDGYWKVNWAIKKVASIQNIRIIDEQMWLQNPVSGFWYSLRDEKDIFSTLIQGTASYVFDVWVMFVVKERPQLTAQFHDEIVLEIKQGFREKCTKLLEDAIQKTNDVVKLNVQLAIGIQYGDHYGQIH